MWFDLGPHLVDQAVQLFGTPDHVLASLTAQRDGAQSDDWAHAILFYGSRRVVLHAGMLVAGGTHRFTVHGDAGSMVKRSADRQERQLLAAMQPGDHGWGEDPDPLVVFDGTRAERLIEAHAGDQRQYYARIVAALSGEASNPVPPEDALIVMTIVEAVARSAVTGRAVTMNDLAERRP